MYVSTESGPCTLGRVAAGTLVDMGLACAMEGGTLGTAWVGADSGASTCVVGEAGRVSAFEVDDDEAPSLVIVVKMSASCCKAARWTRASGASGAASDGLRSAATRSCAAAVASSSEEVAGMSTCDGNQVNVLAIRSAEVASAQMV